MHNITVLSGGMGGARFLQGLLHAISTGRLPGVSTDATVTVVANTADDLWIHGLKVCPDLDTVMYTLGDGIDPGRGWGRRDETWSVKEELATYGVQHLGAHQVGGDVAIAEAEPGGLDAVRRQLLLDAPRLVAPTPAAAGVDAVA